MSAFPDPDWLPAQAYLPGRTPRHAADLFDPLKQVSDALRESPAWQHGQRFFRARFYWEAHEVWEAVWLAAPPNSADRAAVQAVIQIANAALKRRMGRDAAAGRLAAIAQGHKDAALRLEPAPMGLGPEDWAEMWRQFESESTENAL